MGYNLSEHAVKRHLPQLEQMRTERQTLDFPTGSPRRLAYKLREALRAAQEFDQFSHLHHLRDVYKIREIPGAVRAEYVDEHERSSPPMGQPVGERRPSSAPKILPERKSFPDVKNLLEVLAVAAKFSASDQELYFAAAQLPLEDKRKLYKWTSTRAWNYIDHNVGEGGGGITLTKKDVPEEILWTPEEEE